MIVLLFSNLKIVIQDELFYVKPCSEFRGGKGGPKTEL
jgi:hypothetical protein